MSNGTSTADLASHGDPPTDVFDHLVFDNRFVAAFRPDPSVEIRPRQVAETYSWVTPKQTRSPELVALSPEAAELVGLRAEGEDRATRARLGAVLSGNEVLDGMAPWANNYGGHQFGNWAGQLGDGRAIALGEVLTDRGEHLTIQLKGAGPTPYSRRADGLAVLRSSIREFLCSEAMHHLGVPTTRALSLALTGDQVLRDVFYDGNPAHEPGAVVARVAPSFVRFGNFEILASRGDLATLRDLVDFTIRTEFADLVPAGTPEDEPIATATVLDWFREVVRRTALLMVEWMRVGFVHGVMNTDNMSILGLTIDYGPYGWLEDYDPDWTPNTTDAGGRRYRFSNQPAIGQWNLLQLANALYPLIEEAEPLQEALNEYVEVYTAGRRAMMAAKLGISAPDPSTPDGISRIEADEALVDELWAVLSSTETDYTIFFRRLAEVPTLETVEDDDLLAPLLDAYYRPEELDGTVRGRVIAWLHAYRERVRSDGTADDERARRMNSVNPIYVFRNYLAQLAIDKSELGDHSMITELLDVFRHPYDEVPGREQFSEKRPEWARVRAGCSMLSCSS